MKHAVAFIKLSRLHFLAGGVLMFVLGAATTGGINWDASSIALAMVLACQLTAHFVNEYADFDADRGVVNRTSFSGGSGVLVAGTLARPVALRAAYATSAVALVAAAGVSSISLAASAIGVVALAVSWTYSMPPWRLLDTGWGELATAITVAALVPVIGSLAQHHHLSSLTFQLFASIAILLPLQFAMLLAFEIPDLDSDALANKRVFAVRFGLSATLRCITATSLTSLVLLGLAVISRTFSSPAILGLAITSVGVATMIWALSRERHQLATFSAVASFALGGVSCLLGTI